ncbi:hypothetical protein [Nonomuraea roseoviolacea]|uniref:Uncharacterized protein n=1 Tax=Nonomuraea roseoviolacea subsp. carminata TaxID=160689 RepID=A0ABT1K7C1_9ACTN|nr:hypothetical protein [Nonomuraea roseoviolacea]MCP2349886.1 hypothetical protein [Nonomuraea roseoviolacea subsp. carminata]
MSNRNGPDFVMLLERHSPLVAISVAIKVALVAVCIFPLLAGCGSWLQKPIRVEEGALSEVLSVGRVVARTTEDPVYNNTVQIDDVLVMDVDASSFEVGMDVARRRLEQHGWAFSEKVATRTLMNSTRWKDTSLTIEPFRKGTSYAGSWQEYIAHKVHVEPNDQNGYLLVVVSRSHS